MIATESSSFESSGVGRVRGLGYYVGKLPYGRLAPWIAGILPSRRDSCCIEPFAGMLDVLLCRQTRAKRDLSMTRTAIRSAAGRCPDKSLPCA